MDIEPRSLDIPLRKRSWFPLKFAVGCVVVAAVAVRHSRASQWLAAILVLAPVFWLAFGGSSLVRQFHSRASPVGQAVVFALNIAFLILVIWYVVPWAVSLLD
jgi:hypothetical protein